MKKSDKENLENLLINQYERYPEMRIQDMVKLIYQNEFAGGHMIKSPGESLARLKQEYRAYLGGGYMPFGVFEPVGNGLCRLNLAGIKYTDIATVNRLFVSTANSVFGSVVRFEEKLNVLRRCSRLSYNAGEMRAYLNGLKKSGYPPIGHSEAYRAAYCPAYRIVKAPYCDFFEVFKRIDALVESDKPVLVAIDGASASGKSTLASLVSEVYDCNVFHMDDFFLPPERKTHQRLNEPDGNVDYERFKREVMEGLISGQSFSYRAYDCTGQSLGAPIPVSPKTLNIVEGAYSMHPELVRDYDLKIFVQIDKTEQKKRILRRNGAAMLKRFLNEWIPLEDKYFVETYTQGKCDLQYRVPFDSGENE